MDTTEVRGSVRVSRSVIDVRLSLPLCVWMPLLLYACRGSSPGAGCWFNAVALKHDQAGGTVAAGDAGPLTGSDFIPVMAAFSAARPTCVINCAVFAMCAHAGELWSPVHMNPFSLTGSTVRYEGLTETVLMHWTLTHVCYTRLVKGGKVDSRVALLKLPGLELLAGSVSAELHLDCSGTEKGCGPAVLYFAQLVVLHTPRFSKFIHVKLKLSVSSKRVVSPLTVVVSTKTTQLPLQMRRCDHLHQTVPIPRDLQSCDGGEFEQVSIQVDVDAGAVKGKSDACAVLPDGQVLVKADAQTGRVQLH